MRESLTTATHKEPTRARLKPVKSAPQPKPSSFAVAAESTPLRAEQRRLRAGGIEARQQLMTAALRLFSEKGFAKTSTRAIAQAAGVNIASIRYYFGDKAGLYRAMFNEPMAGPEQDHSVFATPHLTLRQSLAGFIGSFLEPMKRGELVQQCAAGLLNIRTDYINGMRELYVAAPGAKGLKTGIDAHPTLRNILSGVQLGILPPAFVDGGRRWWLAELASEAELRAWKPDHASIGVLAKASESMGLCAFARSNQESGAFARSNQESGAFARSNQSIQSRLQTRRTRLSGRRWHY